MALKPTIYKFDIDLSDMDRDYYDSLKLTVALHPSETLERMMARVLAFCLNAAEGLEFTRGLSETSEPDLWLRGLDGQIEHWIDVGEPSVERLKKASGLAPRVSVYSFNSKSDSWWQQSSAALNRLPVHVYQFPNGGIRELAALVERTMNVSVTVTEGTAFVAAALGECEVPCRRLSAI
jgi:uncharacterized protein YaeQ